MKIITAENTTRARTLAWSTHDLVVHLFVFTNVSEVHEREAFKNFHQNESKVIFDMFHRNKQATKIFALKP